MNWLFTGIDTKRKSQNILCSSLTQVTGHRAVDCLDSGGGLSSGDTGGKTDHGWVGGGHASSARFTFEGVSSLGGEPSLMLDHETGPSIHALSLTHILFVCFWAPALPWECLSHDLMAGSMHCVGLRCILAVYFVPRSSRLTSWRKTKADKEVRRPLDQNWHQMTF